MTVTYVHDIRNLGGSDVYKVRGVVLAEKLPVLTIGDVAALLGVSPKTISTYLAESRPGERSPGKPFRYAGHPFPPPDGRIGRAPWWKPAKRAKILAWAASRPGQGAGGGPKPHKAVQKQDQTPEESS